MNVLLLISGLSMGGAENVVTNLADALVASGCQVLVVYMKAPLQVRPRRPEVGLICLGMEWLGGIFSGYFKFCRIVRGFKPDIVHTHMFHATVLARLARLTVDIPALVSSMHTAYDGGRLRAIAYRATDRLTDISTNVSCEAVQVFINRRAVPAGRMVSVYNGIAVDQFRALPTARNRVRRSFSIPEECPLFLAAGRLGSSKDYPTMFKALAKLPKHFNYRLLIAGDGALRPQLEAMVAELGLASRVQFLGIRHDIPELMSGADLFLLSSVAEGFGLVVAEAMACECVVIATDSGGVREVLGDCGFLVPSRDPDAFAAAIEKATSLPPEIAVKLGKAARKRVVDTFGFDRAIDRWHELYGALLAEAERVGVRTRGWHDAS